MIIILCLHRISFSSGQCFSQKYRDFLSISPFKLATTTCILVIMSTMFFLQFAFYSSSLFGIPTKAIPAVVPEVEQPGIAQLSPGILNLITELMAIRNLTSVRFYRVWFPCKKVCLHLLHVEKDWVEFSTVHKLFNKNGLFGLSFQTIFPFFMTMLRWDVSPSGGVSSHINSPLINKHLWVDSLSLKCHISQNILLEYEHLRVRSLVVSDLRSETKGFRFESGC